MNKLQSLLILATLAASMKSFSYDKFASCKFVTPARIDRSDLTVPIIVTEGNISIFVENEKYKIDVSYKGKYNYNGYISHYNYKLFHI